MSKETRTIRPFVGLDEIGSLLDQTALYFGQQRCDSDGSIAVDVTPHEFLLTPVRLEWASDDEALSQLSDRLTAAASELGIPLAKLSVVVIVTSSFFKFTSILIDHPASDIDALPRVSDLASPPRCPALCGPFSGFSVAAYLVLKEALNPEPLRPHLKGSWLARAIFRVDTSLAPALLPPTPLTKEVRERLGLQARVVRYLHFGDHDLFEPYGEQERPTFYIDEELLAALNARRASAESRALQLQLALDFVSAVVSRAAADRERLATVSYEDVRSSILGSVIRIAAGPSATGSNRESILKLLADEPELVIARAEHAMDLSSGFGELMKDGSR